MILLTTNKTPKALRLNPQQIKVAFDSLNNRKIINKEAFTLQEALNC